MVTSTCMRAHRFIKKDLTVYHVLNHRNILSSALCVKHTADKFQLSVLCKDSLSLNREHKVIFLLKKKKETSNKICKCSQGQGSTPTMQRIPEAKPLILIWTIIWNLTDLTREVKRSMFSLLVLESIVLGSSNRLTWIPPLYFHLKLSFM